MKDDLFQLGPVLLTVIGIAFNAFGFVAAQAQYCGQLTRSPYGTTALCGSGGLFLIVTIAIQFALLLLIVRLLSSDRTETRAGLIVLGMYTLLIVCIALFAGKFWSSPLFLNAQHSPGAGILLVLFS